MEATDALTYKRPGRFYEELTMRSKQLTAASRALRHALAELGMHLSHQQAQHVLAKILGSENFHVLSAQLKVSPPPAEPRSGIFVEVAPDYAPDDPEDGDGFDAVVSALDHFGIPTTLQEGAFVRVGPAGASRHPCLSGGRVPATDPSFGAENGG